MNLDHSSRDLRERVHLAVQEGLNRSGRSRADFAFRASTMVVLGDTGEELRRNARTVKKRIGPRARGSRPAWPIPSATRRSITSR